MRLFFFPSFSSSSLWQLTEVKTWPFKAYGVGLPVMCNVFIYSSTANQIKSQSTVFLVFWMDGLQRHFISQFSTFHQICIRSDMVELRRSRFCTQMWLIDFLILSFKAQVLLDGSTSLISVCPQFELKILLSNNLKADH